MLLCYICIKGHYAGGLSAGLLFAFWLRRPCSESDCHSLPQAVQSYAVFHSWYVVNVVQNLYCMFRIKILSLFLVLRALSVSKNHVIRSPMKLMILAIRWYFKTGIMPSTLSLD